MNEPRLRPMQDEVEGAQKGSPCVGVGSVYLANGDSGKGGGVKVSGSGRIVEISDDCVADGLIFKDDGIVTLTNEGNDVEIAGMNKVLEEAGSYANLLGLKAIVKIKAPEARQMVTR